jgi:hypothetical protein
MIVLKRFVGTLQYESNHLILLVARECKTQ